MEIAYLTIYNAHTGQSERIPKPVRYHTLLDFKRYIQQTFDEENNADNLFLLTSFGIKLNFNLINELNDVFVYDKRLFSSDVSDELLQKLHEPFTSIEPKPPVISAQDGSKTSTKQMSTNLKTNLSWARAVSQDSSKIEGECNELVKRINVMFRALNLIFQFGSNFTNEIEKTFNSYLNHIKLINYKSLHSKWSEKYEKLAKFPTFKIKELSVNLASLLDVKKLESSAQYVGDHLPTIVTKLNDMTSVINQVGEDKVGIDGSIESLRNESISAFKESTINSHLEVIQKLSKKTVQDLEQLSTNESQANMQRVYVTHIREYAPEIFSHASTSYKYFLALKSFKQKLLERSFKIFNSIANLQMKMVNVKNDLKVLSSPSESTELLSLHTINKIKSCEDYLSLTIDLPLLFGFMLIEKRRQYEWYDFYSKGIVGNITEQLTTIIDHERLFRKVWLRKIGSFLTLLKEDQSPLRLSLPNIDVTLIGHKEDNFSILYDVHVERSDITAYLEILENSDCPKNFGQLLNKNFRDLMKSTASMKKITTLINSLGTITSMSEEDKSKIIQHGDNGSEENDIDLNLVRDLKLRIKKLENLLHQQQYKNITNWPVTRSNGSADNRASMLMKPVSNPSSDPKQLLQRRNTTGEALPSQSKVLDTSGIDKHLDNIRLRKENAEMIDNNRSLQQNNSQLRNDIKHLKQENETNETTIGELRQQIEQMKINQKAMESEYEAKLAAKQKELDAAKLDEKLDTKEAANYQKKIETKDAKIEELQQHIAKFTELHTKSSYEINDLNNTISKLRSELTDAINMKNDLLSNMSSKETEFTQERNNIEGEIKNLRAKLDESNEDYENLMELTQAKQRATDSLVFELNNIIVKLYGNIGKLIESNFQFFIELCSILESMGLLLVKENDEYKITRVKGLRSKKVEEESPNDIAKSGLAPNKLSSKVIAEIEHYKEWADSLGEAEQFSLLAPSSYAEAEGNEQEQEQEHDEKSKKLIELYTENFKADDNNFEQFLKIISFSEHVQIQEDSSSSKFFLNAVSKRFRDVEGFAKRQTKENKVKEQELNKLLSKLNTKISMNDFHPGDMVLFLPTRIDRDNEVTELFQPWAAFNIGAPHYFLKIDKQERFANKDWMVGKVERIDEHKVTSSNVGSELLNPFQLSVGVVWYMVEAAEVHM